MSDSNDRSSPALDPSSSDPGGESLFERIKTALGLKSSSLRQDLAEALGNNASDFTSEERALLKNILSLRETRVEDIMVPRADIIAGSLDMTLAELLSMFQTAGHSRLPVYADTLDEPQGMVHIRDFVGWLASRKAGGTKLVDLDLSIQLQAVQGLVREVLFVPPSMPILDLLARMQKSRIQLALVIDEYGGTDGLVSMEDIVETVLGDIEDEHDEDVAEMIIQTASDGYLMDARAGMEDVAEVLSLRLGGDTDDLGADTLGGWLVALAGRVPVRGETIEGPGALRFEIIDADPRRIKRVRVTVSPNRNEPEKEVRASGLVSPRSGTA